MNWYRCAAKPKEVPLKGVLRNNDGYIYLDVDSRVVAPFLNMIDDDSVVHPKSVTNPDKDVGAHITVMTKDETNSLSPSDDLEFLTLDEVGEEYEFFIEGLHTVKPDGWDKVKKVYFLTVKSPDLEKLRKNHDLPAKIKDHDFHITIGVEKNAQSNLLKVAETDSYLSSSDGRQKGWEDQMGDIQRYSYDPYQVRVYVTRLAESKITVSITLHHVWAGSIIWQDFWSFMPKEMTAAKSTYNKVVDAANKVFQDFRTSDIPNTLINSYLREAVRFIDIEHKPASRVPYVDWAREQKGVADWRSSIYGTRYPTPQGY